MISTPAPAQEGPAPSELPLDFSWIAPETCPTRAQVIAELSNAVDAGGKELPPLRARAVVEQRAGTWHLELDTEIDGRRGTRFLEADSCEGLARAATLVMALTLGEGLARRQAEAAAEAKAPEPREPARPPPEPPPAAEPRPRSSRAWAVVWGAAGVSSDALGAFGPALALGAAYQPGMLRIGARLEATLPRTSAFAAGGEQVRGQSGTIELELCLSPTFGEFQLAACAAAGATLLFAAGEGTERDSQARIPLYGVGPGASALWLVHDNAYLSLGAASRAFVSRPELVIEGLTERRQIEPFSVGLFLGGGARW